MKKYIYLIIGITILNSGCEKIFMEPNPGTSNIDIFNEYAKLVKEKFAMLEFKDVDIDFLKDSIGATVNNELSEKELFAKLTAITNKLRDGHSDLSNEDTSFIYDFYSSYPKAFDRDILIDNYIGKSIAPDITWLESSENDATKAIYGHLPQSADIGYLRIGSWLYHFSDEEIEMIFATFKNDKGLIIDIRNNSGGDPELSTKFASYFTNNKIYIGNEHFKTGPGMYDFADSRLYLKPSESENKFLKPVMILTDIWCFSATTTFMYNLNPLPNITFIGQRTGGGAGSVADGFLANGWHWDLSTSEFIDLNGNHWDNGWDPDINVKLNIFDKTKDEILERALYELNNL
ncbi:MAG: S41 family peptidase [Chlorobi bacterium]|nr:S41 family peptidase [Chlorobiota bacterium]